MEIGEIVESAREGEISLGLDDVIVTLSPGADDSMLVSADLGEVPHGALVAVAREAMVANHLFEGTAGATISVDPKTGHAFLQQYEWVWGRDPDGFMRRLLVFVGKVREWRSKVEGGGESPVEKPMEGLDHGFLIPV